MNFRKKFGGITITQVSGPPTEYQGSYWHRQKTPEPPMYAWVYPVCLRADKSEPQREHPDLAKTPCRIVDSPPNSLQEEGNGDKNEAQTAAGNSRGNRSGSPSRNRRGGARSKPKSVRRKR